MSLKSKFYIKNEKLNVRRIDFSYAREILNAYQVKFKFTNWVPNGGFFNASKQSIVIGVGDSTIQEFWCAVFHELAHVLNAREKKFWRYHRPNCTQIDIIKTGLRAEQYTDLRGMKLAKQHKVNINWEKTYFDFDKKSKQEFYEFHGIKYRNRKNKKSKHGKNT